MVEELMRYLAHWCGERN